MLGAPPLTELADELFGASVVENALRYLSHPRILKAARMRLHQTQNVAEVPSNGDNHCEVLGILLLLLLVLMMPWLLFCV